MAAPAKPATPEQFKAALLDPRTLKEMVEDDKLSAFVDDYEAEQIKATEAQVDKARVEGITEFLKGDHLKRLPQGDEDEVEWDAGFTNVNGHQVKSGWGQETLTRGELRTAQARLKESDTWGFKSPRDYYNAIWTRTIMREGTDPRLSAMHKDLSINIGVDGGFLVPEVLRSQLLMIPLEGAIVRPRAFVVPMDSQRVPFPTIDATSNATNVFGAVAANWTDENATITESQPTFGRTTLEAHKLALYTEVPSELFSDSIISIEALLGQLLPAAVAYFEDDAFLVGTGAGRPLGAVAAANPALIDVTRDTTSEINWEDIVNMYARMLPTSKGRSVWVGNQEIFPQLATMSLDVGTGGSAIWLNNGVSGPPAMVLGRPYFESEKVPALGSAGDLSFVDFGQYLLGDRQMFTMSASVHFKFQQDQTAIRGIQRVDGQPWLRSAITPRNGTNTLSPYIRLAA